MVPVLRMPPPKASTAGVVPGRPTTSLSDTTAWERVRLPALSTPPPRNRPYPRVMVSPSISTAAPLAMLKTRLVSLPLTARRLAPGPTRDTSSVMLNSPLVRVIVPRTPDANVMTSAPGLVLAAVIAARSESEPLSARLPTLKVLGTVRSSSCKTLSRVDGARVVSLVGRCPCFAPSGTKRERAARSQEDRRIGKLLGNPGLRYNGETSFPARRPGAGAVPGRWVSFFAVGTHRLFRLVQRRIAARRRLTSPSRALRRPAG